MNADDRFYLRVLLLLLSPIILIVPLVTLPTVLASINGSNALVVIVLIWAAYEGWKRWLER